MFRTLSRVLCSIAGGIVLNATAHLCVLLGALVAWSPPLYETLYAGVATPVIPLYALLSHADAWYDLPPHGGLILRLLVLNSLVWGLLAAAGVAVLRVLAPTHPWWSLRWPTPDVEKEHPRRIPHLRVLLLGLSLTILSLGVIDPPACGARRCVERAPQAGFPLVMVWDRGGESPISGWGHLQMEDAFRTSPGALVVNTLGYSSVIWLIWKGSLLLAAWREQRHQRPTTR